MASAIIAENPTFVSQGAISILGIILSLVLVHIYISNKRETKLGLKIPGDPPLPFLGNVFDLIGIFNNDLFKELEKKRDKYGPIGRAWLGTHLIVGLGTPQDAEIILNSREHIEKSSEYSFFKPWLGDGLLISSGDKWHKDRQLIAPAFHQNVLKSFLDIFNKNSVMICDEMQKEIGKVFDVHDYMSTVTVDTLLETAMGTKRTKQSKGSFDYAMAVMKMCDVIHKRQFTFYLRPDFLFNFSKLKKRQDKLLRIIHGLTETVFRSKKEEFVKNAAAGHLPTPSLSSVINESSESVRQKVNNESIVTGLRDDLDDQDENDVGEKRRLAFLDLMIEMAYNRGNLTESEIKEQVDTIMFEGHDTTAAASSFFLCLVGIYKDVQQKVYEELYNIFGDSDRPVSLADTYEMKYLERVLFETLRLYPPVPAIARKVKQDIQIVTNNYVIPAGSTVVVVPYEIHRNRESFPNPEEFNPDNFLPEKTQNRHYYSFVPFSAGPRSCVGRKYAVLKLKILLATILRKYKVHSPVSREQFKLRVDIILKREDGFQLKIEPRIKSST